MSCSRCGRDYPIEDGIPLMFAPHEGFGTGGDVTEEVKSFYEETPFPNYDDHDSVRSLIEKSRRGVYAKMLNDAIPFNTTVLEVGCGTGQLSNFLGIGCRRVIGDGPVPQLASTRRGVPNRARSLAGALSCR